MPALESPDPRPRAPRTRFRRRFESGGTWWAEDHRGLWYAWDQRAADWVVSTMPPPSLPPEEEADPWRHVSHRESLAEFFSKAGPGRNLVIASVIMAAGVGLLWLLSFAWDPFGLRSRDPLDAIANIFGTGLVIGLLVNGVLRGRRGLSFFPPEIRNLRFFRDWRRELARFLTIAAVLTLLMWWGLGYLKPFGVTPFEFGTPWENPVPLMFLWMTLAAAAVVAWTLALRRPPPRPR